MPGSQAPPGAGVESRVESGGWVNETLFSTRPCNSSIPSQSEYSTVLPSRLQLLFESRQIGIDVLDLFVARQKSLFAIFEVANALLDDGLPLRFDVALQLLDSQREPLGRFGREGSVLRLHRFGEGQISDLTVDVDHVDVEVA